MLTQDNAVEKSYAIYYCLQYFPGGIDKIVASCKLLTGNKLVGEALGILEEKFNSPEHVGPVHITEFLQVTDTHEAERIQRDAYERVQYLVKCCSG